MDFMDEDIHASTTHTAPTAPVVAPVATVVAPDELAPDAPVVHLPVTPSEMGLETPPGGQDPDSDSESVGSTPLHRGGSPAGMSGIRMPAYPPTSRHYTWGFFMGGTHMVVLAKHGTPFPGRVGGPQKSLHNHGPLTRV